jgi:phospho-N-acetylmuramoyl-pentapeptide-transferase
LLYWLLYLKLFHYFPPFRIFRYLTFRTAFASLTYLGVTAPWSPAPSSSTGCANFRSVSSSGKRAQGPSEKAGTPTMGGLLIAISIVVPALLWAD